MMKAVRGAGGPALPGESGESMRILVVEDIPGITDMVERILIAAGMTHTIVRAYTVAGAIRAVQEQPPDLVLTNLDLERRYDGLEVLEFLGPSDIPVLLFTAYGPVPAYKYRRWGAAGCITKPFSPSDLLVGLAPFLRDAPSWLQEDSDSIMDRLLDNWPADLFRP